jgi:hypothetical protein
MTQLNRISRLPAFGAASFIMLMSHNALEPNSAVRVLQKLNTSHDSHICYAATHFKCLACWITVRNAIKNASVMHIIIHVYV